MRTSLRHLFAAGLGIAAIAPGALATSTMRSETTLLKRSTMGQVPSSGATLLVTFAGTPSGVDVVRALGDLGRVRQSVPDAGIWELVPIDAATVRANVVRRTGVVRAEWSMTRQLSAFPATRRPAIPALPTIAVADPTDPRYADAVGGQWSMHTGRWSPSLTGQTNRPIIAILDAGLDTTQNEWKAPGVTVSPWSTARNIPSAPDISISGHGTHVAGIAAAPIDGNGVVGVAPASASHPIMPVQVVLNSAGSSTDATIMAGITYAVNHGAKVINISSGGPGYSQAFQDTVNWATKRGALIMASVGNEGLQDNGLNFPAGYDHVIGVGAQCDGVVDSPYCPTAYGRAMFSNSNFSVDVLAPGVNILSTLASGVADMTEPAGYGRMDGTSMASPFVAGTAALAFSSHPGATPFQVGRLIEMSGSRAVAGFKRNDTAGWGVVSPAKAVTTTAPINDITEPNDDVNWVPSTFNIALPSWARTKTFSAYADYNDDPMDVYAVPLYKGKRVRVTITSSAAVLRAYAFNGAGRISPRIMSDANFVKRFEGGTRYATPTTRAFVFTAKTTGRHYLQILAFRGGGNYSVKLERLN